ncbi:MAG: monovalent cation/H(+) antiporter subunit G [Proteobacteria bacterium]|nr:monovalent cation/H(+) antiporter subunit G [Pseudomonadota bacterium]
MIIDVLSFVLLALGGFFVFMGGLGALRLPDFYTRMHAASLTDSLGTILTLGGIMLQSGWSLATVKLMTILFFLMLTGPTATYALANAALLAEPDLQPVMPPASRL